MKNQPKSTIAGHNLSSSTGDYIPPTLHDSKSLTYLNTHLDEHKKFRETTYYPGSHKNTHFQLLRYTVNTNRQQKDKSIPQALPKSYLKIVRKNTEQISMQNHPQSEEKSDKLPKFGQKIFYSPKKKTYLEKNPQILQHKNFIEYSAKIDKKIVQEQKQKNATTNNSVTERDKDKKPFQTKKIYSPKYQKAKQNEHQSKLITSYSSSNLLKDHANSPTSQSRSSNMIKIPEKKSTYPEINDFKKVKFIGEGKFGQVHLVFHKKTNSVYALKQIKKQVIIKNKMEEQLLMEIKLQLFFNHPNILKLYGFFYDQENIYLILQYMEEGTLYSHLRKLKTLKQAEASRKLRDVIDGIAYLHSMSIAHRDIKPENIVVSHDVCKICDLGWAAVCQDRRKTLCGTIDYASPELLEGKDYDIAIDLWCLGVLCFELLVGKAPFYHVSRKQTMKKIINADASDINIPANVPPETRDFIGKLLRKIPEQRMSAESALSHPLILIYKDQELDDFRGDNRKKV